MTKMVRLADCGPGDFPEGYDAMAMAYWKQSTVWMVSLGGDVLGTLVRHNVQEHEDGTITVTPSIKVTSPGISTTHRHGFLTRGVWHPCGDDRP